MTLLPYQFTLLCITLYGLFATLGIYELLQAIEEDYLRDLLISFFIFNVIFTLFIVYAGYSWFISNDSFGLKSTVIIYSIAKVILSSIALSALAKDQRVMALCLVEVALIFGPIFFLLLLYDFYIIHPYTIQGEEQIVYTVRVSDSIVLPGRWVAYGLFMVIITFAVIGILDMVQAITEDYLRSIFISFTVSNMVLPTLTIFILDNFEDDVSFYLFFACTSKIVLASFALHAMIVDSNISILAQVLCYIEIALVFGSIALLLLYGIVNGVLQLAQFCFKFHKNNAIVDESMDEEEGVAPL